MESEPKKYEIAYLISPTVTEEGVIDVAGKLSSLIQEATGTITKIEEPKKVKLAYAINKTRNAYFGWTLFTLNPENVEGLRKKLKFETKTIIRYLLVEEEIYPEKFIPRTPRLRTVTTERPAAIKREVEKSEEKVDVEQLDKKLEEILNK